MKRLLLAALAAGLACRMASAGDEPETMRVPLRFQALENAVADGGMVRLRREYRQADGGPVVFEAEEATVVELQSLDRRIVQDPESSAQHFIEHVKKLEANFTVEKPGLYQVRLRAWFPLKAPYNHNESMDDGEVRRVDDSQSEDPGIWFWTQGLTYDLAEGAHHYVFPSPNAFCGGARLDKVAILPADHAEVEGLGPPVSPISTPSEGKAITKRINLRLIKAFELKYEISENGGSADVEYSYDQTQWQPIPSGQWVGVPTPKPRFLYFRFRLSAKPAGLSPWVQGLALTVKKEASPAPVGQER